MQDILFTLNRIPRGRLTGVLRSVTLCFGNRLLITFLPIPVAHPMRKRRHMAKNANLRLREGAEREDHVQISREAAETESPDTELRKAYEELEQMCTYYAELYEDAPVGYITVSASGLIDTVNRTGARLLGVSRETLLRRHFAGFIADEDRERWIRQCLRARPAQGKHQCDLTLQRPDGTCFHAHLDCLHRQPKGEAHALHLTLSDITVRKQAEDALKTTALAFEAQVGIMVTDADRRVIRVNEAFSRITGFAPEDIIGRTPTLLSSGQHDEAFYQALWAAVARENFWQGEIQDVRKDGGPLPVWLTVSAAQGADGRITHYVGSFTDLTLQKQAEGKLLDACIRLGEQASNVQRELENQKDDHAGMKTALKVLLKAQETQRAEASQALSEDLEKTVLPFLRQLKAAEQTPTQKHLLASLESNLTQLMQSYGQASSLAALYRKLTPVEIQVASLVRQGLPTKVIAATLNISPGTVASHRKGIRKKLGLIGNKSNNLQTYLQSLPDG